MSRAFISYSRRNTNFAERLARDLTDAGIEVWIDFRQIHAGERWKDEIRRGIERSDVVIAVLSPESVVSEWVQFEVLYGREQEKIILPVMASSSLDLLRQSDILRWLLDVHFINFENRYEEAFPELLKALPGKRRLGSFDVIDPAFIPNPFKGLEAFQQTDASFFFGREQLVKKALAALKPGRSRRFLAVVGASGSGKSSLVRAGVIPQIRAGAVNGSQSWRVAIFTPGEQPIKALATRIAPLLPDDVDADAVQKALQTGEDGLSRVASRLMADAPASTYLLLVVDQFEETFTRATESGAAEFIALLNHAATVAGGRCIVTITMRADFFDRLGRYPEFAELFEADQLLIVTEMTPANLLRAITGPADAVGLTYEDGLADRILEDVRRQPGSLPLLQYALTELYTRRDGRRLTHMAYDAIGGVEQALARHAEGIFLRLGAGQQDTMRRILLRLIEIAEDGTATRRKVAREELSFMGVSDQAVQEIIDRLTSADSRLLVTSREIRTSANQTASATVWVEVGHEALIREWTRFQDWIAADLENLRMGADILKAATDWLAANRDVAYVLRGTRLVRAEEWLDSADANALQREFIRASVDERERREEVERDQAERELVLQRRSANRLRAFVVVLAGALMLTAGLVLFAFSERDRAEQNARIAEENRAAAEASAELAERSLERSNSFALSALAGQALNDGNSEMAVALAVEANLIAQSPPPQASLTLAEVAFAPGTRQNFEPSGQSIGAVAISRDERIVAAASTDGVALYDARTGERLSLARTMPVPEGNSIEVPNITALTNVTALAINPQGTHILAGTQNGLITLYDLATGAESAVWKSQIGRAINSLAFNSTGTRAVSADSNNQMIVWTADGQRFRSLSADRAVAYFWPLDEEVVISAGRDNLITAWDIPSGNPVKRIRAEIAHLSLALSPDGEYALTGGGGTGDNTGARVALWELGTINRDGPHAPIPPESEITQPLRVYTGHTVEASLSQGVGFAEEGELIVSAGSEGRLLVWERESGDLLTAFTVSGDADLRALAISDDGQQALSGGDTDGAAVLRLWDLRSASVVTDMRGHTGRTVGVFIPRPDGIARTILTGGVDDDPRTRDDDELSDNLRVFDIASGRTIQQLRGHEGLIVDVDISPDGMLAVSGSADNTVRVWNLAAGTHTVVGRHNSALRDVAFMPDGESVLAISRGGEIIRWNALAENDRIHTYIDPAGQERSLQTLAVSRDGRYLLTGSDSNIVKLWDAENGDMLQTYQIEDRAVRALAFSPDGSKIIVGSVNGSLTLFETTGALIRTLAGHNRAVLSASFTDENTLLSTAFDNTMRVWDLNSGFEVRRFDTSDEPTISLNTASISPDGQLVMTGLSDGRVRVWRLYPTLDRLLAWTRANRDIMPLPDCDMREQFSLDPCDANGQPPPFQWPELPTLNPLPESAVALQPDVEVYINTTADTLQRVRPAPGLDNAPIATLEDGTRVAILDGPQSASGLWWWQIEAEDGLTGWVSEYIPSENIQSLVPVSALE